ncbi:hypothetical protein [Kitasatospora griseola]|uniref:hypothetical protein n=1 Tax=Kitasatospora griseola TaxID=2064 RepID=UPI00364A17CC
MTAPEQQAAPEPDLRQLIAQALMSWGSHNNSPAYAALRKPAAVTANAYSRADAVLAVVEPELAALRAERDAFADRVDTLTAVCKSNKQAYKGAVEECEQLALELAGLAAENARLRAELDEMGRLSHHYRTTAESAEHRLAAARPTRCSPACTEQHTYDGCCQLGPTPTEDCPLPPATCAQRQCTQAPARPTT